MIDANDVSKLKPTIRPTTTTITSDSRFVAMSAIVRPASTAARAIGSERKRSISPRFRSSASPSAVAKPPKAMFWITMPGIRKSA